MSGTDSDKKNSGDIHSLRSLGIIAGRGVYPRVLIESARAQGVQRIIAVAFRKETDPSIDRLADQVHWVRLGELQPLLDALQSSQVETVVMAGQLKPTHLFTVRVDAAMRDLLARLEQRNAHTIFGAVADELQKRGLKLQEASLFMESTMPPPGQLAGSEPDAQQQADIDLGMQVAKTTSQLDIGQTVVIKEGTIIAIEAFEGTDKTIRRAGKLAGKGSVVVKVAKQGHDMRFDIPVIGERTIRMCQKAGVAVLAIEAGRTILLDLEAVTAAAHRAGLKLVAIKFSRASQV